MTSLESFINKKITLILFIALFGSSGLGVTSLHATNQTNATTIEVQNEMLIHKLDEHSHPLLIQKMTSLENEIKELKEEVKSTGEKIDRMFFLFCTHNGYQCDF